MPVEQITDSSNFSGALSNGHSHRINAIADIVQARSYLEIGVENGNTFLNVAIENKVAVDPRFLIEPEIQQAAADQGHQFFEKTSDEFFNVWDKNNKFDVILIDGLHTYAQTLRDFTNSLSVSHANTVWVIDDVLPTNYASVAQTQMEFQRLRKADPSIPPGWYGDTYKILYFIQSYFPSFSMLLYGGKRGQAVLYNDIDGKIPQNLEPCGLEVEDICDVDFSRFQLDRARSFPEMSEQEVFSKLRQALKQ